MIQNIPHLIHEKRLWKKGYFVIGVDEVGRGAFAGPLVLAGVILRPTASIESIKKLISIGINDSKKLTPGKREELSKIIKKIAFSYSFSSISVGIINKHGISKATSIGVRKVVKNLMRKTRKPNTKYLPALPCRQAGGRQGLILDTRYYLLMDAFYIKYVKGIGLKHQKAIVHGDTISLSIAAASIIAKVKRDNMMVKLSGKHPAYMWHENKGYGTLDHRKALTKLGKTDFHRIQFVQKLNALR